MRPAPPSKTCGFRPVIASSRSASSSEAGGLAKRAAEAPFEEALRLGDPQFPRDDDVVPDLRMRVEREVVGGERDVPVEEGLEAPLHREVDDPRLVLPVLAVVDEEHLRPGVLRALKGLEGGRDRRGDLRHLVGSDDLEAHRAVVVEAVEVEQLARMVEDCVA